MTPASPGAGVVIGTGACQGDRLVASSNLDAIHALPAGTVMGASGVGSRYYAGELDQVDMAVAASRIALADAGIGAGELDAVLHAAAVPFQTIPATAPLVQRGLGIADGAAVAFDLNATCLGFLAGLDLATAMIAAGRWRHVLLVCAERASRGLDWADPATAGLFGDGAGAAVLAPAKDQVPGARVLHVAMETHPSAYDASGLVAGGTRLDHDADGGAFERHRRFAMDGPALFALTRRRFAGFVGRALDRGGWALGDVDCVVPHQASPAALRLMARSLGIPEARLVDVSATHGNQIAASLPIALDAARRDGRAGPGRRVLLLGTAAGVTFGAALLRT